MYNANMKKNAFENRWHIWKFVLEKYFFLIWVFIIIYDCLFIVLKNKKKLHPLCIYMCMYYQNVYACVCLFFMMHVLCDLLVEKKKIKYKSGGKNETRYYGQVFRMQIEIKD